MWSIVRFWSFGFLPLDHECGLLAARLPGLRSSLADLPADLSGQRIPLTADHVHDRWRNDQPQAALAGDGFEEHRISPFAHAVRRDNERLRRADKADVADGARCGMRHIRQPVEARQHAVILRADGSVLIV